MEHLTPRTAWPSLLAALITMMIAAIIMVTVVNIAAAAAASHFSSLAGSDFYVFVGTNVHLVAISANHTPSSRVESLVRRVNILRSVMPLILVITICTIAVLLYLVYRRWYRMLTSPQVAPPVQPPSPAAAPRRQYPRRVPRPLVTNSQVTLPRYSPPPEHWEHVELVEMSPGRSPENPENRAEEQQSSPARSPAPSA